MRPEKEERKITFILIAILLVITATALAVIFRVADKSNATNKEAANPAEETVTQYDGYDSNANVPDEPWIYPRVMVEGKIYEWTQRLVEPVEELPEDCIYYADITSSNYDTPTQNGEFVSNYEVSGQIYRIPGSESSIYLCLTSDWSGGMVMKMENKIVIFDLLDE